MAEPRKPINLQIHGQAEIAARRDAGLAIGAWPVGTLRNTRKHVGSFRNAEEILRSPEETILSAQDISGILAKSVSSLRRP